MANFGSKKTKKTVRYRFIFEPEFRPKPKPQKLPEPIPVPKFRLQFRISAGTGTAPNFGRSLGQSLCICMDKNGYKLHTICKFKELWTFKQNSFGRIF